MSSPSEIANSIKQYLAARFMYAEEEWLSGCVEYLTQDAENNYTENEIRNLAREQWLLNDLKDICPGCLPANLKSARKTELNGKFVLQINAAIDIGTPAYQQYLKLQKVNMENIEATTRMDEKIPNHRMIKLYLTDGVQNISGIEYKPMRNISCDITPGCKVLIKGPVTCRRGILLLTESNVELLGGEVEDLTSIHSLPALLSSKLGVTLLQDTNRVSSILQPRSGAPSFESQNPINQDNHRPVARVVGIPINNHSITEEDIDLDQLAAIEAQFANDSNKRTRSPDVSPENNAGKKMRLSNECNATAGTSQNNIHRTNDDPRTTQNNLNFPSTQTNSNFDIIDDIDEDLFLNEDVDYLREMEARIDEEINVEYPIKVNMEPYVYIRQIKDLDRVDYLGRNFRIKGQILKLLSKLSVGKDGWCLKCTLIDGTGCLDVEFTSDVLSELVGYTPAEMNKLKKDMVAKPEIKAVAVAALHKAKDSLQVLNCIIEIEIAATPKIIGLHPFEGSHGKALKCRLDNVKL